MNPKETMERLKIGTKISQRLSERKTRGEVAAELGISREAVRQIECMALWKIAKRLDLLTEFKEETAMALSATIHNEGTKEFGGGK